MVNPDAPWNRPYKQGELSFERLENYRKLLAELSFQERKVESRRWRGKSKRNGRRSTKPCVNARNDSENQYF